MRTTIDKNQAPAGYIELVRENNRFRLLWLGQIVSLLGDWFNLIASATLVAALTQSGLAVGGLFVVRMLAPFLVSPAAGVVADRYNRKHILIITDVTRSIVMLGFLLVRDAGDIWLLYALTAIQLGISGFFFPTRNAILPDLVASRELGAANILSSTTWSTMLAFGAAIGGIVSGTLGIYTAFMIDAVTFLLSAFFIARIPYDAQANLDATETSFKAALREYIDGLRYLARHPNILIIALHKAMIGLLPGPAFDIIQVAIAERVFVIGEGGGVSLGLMFAATGVGTGLGPLAVRRFTGDEDRLLRLAIIGGYLIGAAGLAVAAPLLNFELVLLGSVLRGLGVGIIWVFSTQLLLQLVPGHMRGRVFATEFAFFTLASAVGSALTGRALDSPLTISGVTWGVAGLSLAPALVWTLWLIVNKRD